VLAAGDGDGDGDATGDGDGGAAAAGDGEAADATGFPGGVVGFGAVLAVGEVEPGEAVQPLSPSPRARTTSSGVRWWFESMTFLDSTGRVRGLHSEDLPPHRDPLSFFTGPGGCAEFRGRHARSGPQDQARTRGAQLRSSSHGQTTEITPILVERMIRTIGLQWR
jgi:hypothetical protein